MLKIENHFDHCKLIFIDTLQHLELFREITGFLDYGENYVKFHFDLGIIENKDVGAIIKEIKNCLQTENKNIVSPDDTYYKLISNILSVGDIYSSFIELILSILYVGHDNKIIRYQLKEKLPLKIEKKFSVKEAHNFISPVLSLLYEPNIHSIKKYYNHLIKQDSYLVSIYEKIWMDLI